jgi:1,4-dihydroxy-2-naphthoate octaprenyltransferase
MHGLLPGKNSVRISWKHLVGLVRLSRPHFLLGGFLLFGLGASIANYLGHPIRISLYLIGQLLVTSIQLTTQYLNEYFDGPADAHNANRTLMSGGSGMLGENGLPRSVPLYAAVVTLTITATGCSLLLLQGSAPLLAWLLLALGFLGAFLYNAPPARLIESGYGELIASVVVAGILPAFSFALQTGELHRLLIMSTAPLIAFHFAMVLIFELPDYATDVKFEKRTLMVRLGWKNGMRMHDLAIAFAVLALILAYLNGLPQRVALGALIALPLAIAQIWQLGRIRQGYPPRWQLLTLSATGLFALTAYLEMVGYILS